MGAEIPGQDRRGESCTVIVEPFVHGGLATALVALIDDIIMDEECAVEELRGEGGCDDAIVVSEAFVPGDG